MIAVGDHLPEMTFALMTVEGPTQATTAEVFAGKKIALFAVPGAFTPTCNNNHLPGYINHLDALRGKGVDKVVCISVNDVFVMDAWAKQAGGQDKITFLADGSAAFTKAIGLDLDLGPAGLGVRSKRYSMLVDDGVVKQLNIEDSPGTAVTSGAEALLDQL